MAGLLVAGTCSDAGKSLVVTGLCRAWARQGRRVAPFKAQNMSNNSMVCRDGSEIGRAQYLQCQAAGVEASSVHNPVLLKPATDRTAFVVVRGQPAGRLEAGEYATGRRHLAQAAFTAYEQLCGEVDVVVAEGAGSPAEVNLRAGDYVNLGLARRFGLPVVLVGDIDRGGVLAALYGTWGLLDDDADRALLRAYVINRFRGDPDVLEPGLRTVTARTGMPCAGILPWLADVWTDSEDTLSLGRWTSQAGLDRGRLSVAVVAFPRASNVTDVDALATEPGVDVHLTRDPRACHAADLLVLPGSRATVADLAWLRERGIGDVVIERARAGRPVMGICGGYQMLCRVIDDPVESRTGPTRGLGVLDAAVSFRADKTLGRPAGEWHGIPVQGYAIHHGVVADDRSFPGGMQAGTVWGTMWHGNFECDAFRRQWLSDVAELAGSRWQPTPGLAGFAAHREGMIDHIADACERLDLDMLLRLSAA